MSNKEVNKNIELKPGDTGFTTIIREIDGDKNLTDKVHSCDECDFQSSSVAALQKHINITHDGGQAIKCGECDYETKSKKDFAIHMRDIHIPRVFMCDHQALAKYNLKMHRMFT